MHLLELSKCCQKPDRHKFNSLSDKEQIMDEFHKNVDKSNAVNICTFMLCDLLYCYC